MRRGAGPGAELSEAWSMEEELTEAGLAGIMPRLFRTD